MFEGLQKSQSFSDLCESPPDSAEARRIGQCRLFCYGFRSGGFVEAAEAAIRAAALPGERGRCLSRAASSLRGMLGLRAEPVPCDIGAVATFHAYVRLADGVLRSLRAASEAEALGGQAAGVQETYERFKVAMERITSSEGPCAVNCSDEFLLRHGAIDLPDQGLKIVQMIFSNDLGLHFAVISPQSGFCHGHGELSEVHFVEQKCPYEHYVNGKRSRVREADVVAMAPGVAHGGRNVSDSEEVRVYFAAGDRRYGPWRADFNDRTNHPTEGLAEVDDITQLNGASLKRHIEDMLSSEAGRSTVISPSQCAGKTGYGVCLEALHVTGGGLSIRDSDSDLIVKVLSGSGGIAFEEVAAPLPLAPQDCLPIPNGMACRIESERGMVMLGLSLRRSGHEGP